MHDHQESANALANPFGNDTEDLPVSEMLLRNVMLARSVFERTEEAGNLNDFPNRGASSTKWLSDEAGML